MKEAVAQVAAALGLECIIVAPGGLGQSFDLLSINLALLEKHGVRLKGVILNRVPPHPPRPFSLHPIHSLSLHPVHSLSIRPIHSLSLDPVH